MPANFDGIPDNPAQEILCINVTFEALGGKDSEPLPFAFVWLVAPDFLRGFRLVS